LSKRAERIQSRKVNKKTANKTPTNYKPKGGKTKDEEIKEIITYNDLRSRLRQPKLTPSQNPNV